MLDAYIIDEIKKREEEKEKEQEQKRIYLPIYYQPQKKEEWQKEEQIIIPINDEEVENRLSYVPGKGDVFSIISYL